MHIYIPVLSDWLQATAVSAGRAEHAPVVQGYQVALVHPPEKEQLGHLVGGQILILFVAASLLQGEQDK
jgi:hypothetical protein